MNDRERTPPTQIATTRVASGFSPRLVVLIVVGLLVGTVSIAVYGRQATTAQPPPNVAVAGPPTLSPSADPPSATEPMTSGSKLPPAAATPTPTRRPVVQREVIPLGDDAFGVAAMIGERHFYTLLEEVEPGRLVGLFRVPFPRPAKVVDVKLAQFWGRDTDRNFVRLGRWKLALTPLTPETKQQGVLLRLSVPAEPKSDGAPRPIRLGYSLLIRAESRLSFGVVTFEMRIGESG